MLPLHQSQSKMPVADDQKRKFQPFPKHRVNAISVSARPLARGHSNPTELHFTIAWYASRKTTYIHTYMSYIFVYVHVIHTYIHTYIHTCHKFLYTYMSCMHTYIHTEMQSYIIEETLSMYLCLCKCMYVCMYVCMWLLTPDR